MHKFSLDMPTASTRPSRLTYPRESALITASGRVYDGANVENAAYPQTMCAERVAIFKAVSDGIYPSPPARFENLATKGKPTGLALEFIKWILTDGQQYLHDAGYVPLTAEQQAESLQKLK